MEQIRTFEGGLNTDDALETMPPQDYPFLLNGVKAKSADGKHGTIENVIGTSNALPTIVEIGLSTCIGAIRDQKNNAWFLFFYHATPANHCIIKLTAAATTRTAGTLSKVIAWSGLLFDPAFLITGGCVADNVLYFTDNKNGPRCINVEKYAGGSVPTSEEDISLLKRGGIYPPTFVKQIDSSVDVSLIGKFGFQFAYQYEYEDNQFSVSSPISILCPRNTRTQTENKVRISIRVPTTPPEKLEAIPQLVVRIRFMARIGNIGPMYYIADLAAKDWAPNTGYAVDGVAKSGGLWWQAKIAHISVVGVPPVEGPTWTALSLGVDFYNNTNGNVVPAIYLNQYHLVPRKAKCLEFIKNRLWLANFLEGYNTPRDAGMTVTLDTESIDAGGTTSKLPPSLNTAPKNIYRITKKKFVWTLGVWVEAETTYVTDTLQYFSTGTTTDVMIIDPSTVDVADVRTVSGTRVRWHPVKGFYVNEISGTWSGSEVGTLDPPTIAGVLEGDIVYAYASELMEPNMIYLLNIIQEFAVTEIKDVYKISYINWRTGTPTNTYTNVGSGNIAMDVQPFDGGSTVDVLIVNPVVTSPVSAPTYGYGPCERITGTRVKWDAVNGWYEAVTTNPFTGVTGNIESPPTHFGAYDSNVINSYELVPFQAGKNYLADINAYEGARTFPSGSSYKLGYILKDEHGRDLGGVITSNLTSINTPKTYFNVIKATWNFPLTTPAGSIPVEAKSYSIVMSRNLTKNYFIEYRSTRTAYYKGKTTPVLSNTYDPSNDGIYLDLTPIGRAGIGYEFKEGDRLILYSTPSDAGWSMDSDTVWDMPITSFDGSILKCPNRNVGTFLTGKCNFEIYRPVLEPSEILYYEIGQTFPIVAGDFSVKAGVIQGDCVNTVRPNFVYSAPNTYIIDADPDHESLYKAMSTDPLGTWDTDSGKPYIKVTIGEVLKSNYFRHSATIINDTNVNGLCEHYVEDEGNVPMENGPINKLKSTSRQADEGNVMLAISRNETASIYVDEQTMNLDVKTSFMIQTNSVIGAIKTLKSNALGTVHPESVYDYNGNVFWWDQIHQKVVRYATNGLFPISDVKMVNHFERSATQNNAARVHMGYDPFYRLFVITHTNGLAQRSTVSWSEEQKRWISFHNYTSASWYMDLDSVFYSVNGGHVFAHLPNSIDPAAGTNYNKFYGNVFDTVLELSFNDGPDKPKYWSTVAILLSKNFWTWVGGEQKVAAGRLTFELENEFGQSTDVLGERFDYDENIGYGTILKDKNTVGVPNPYVNGDDMFSHIATGRLTIIGQPNDVYKRISFVKVGFEVSKGHTL